MLSDHRVTTHHHDDHSVVTLSGEFDLASRILLRDGLLEALDTTTRPQVLVDLTDVKFLDSTALGTLVEANRHATRRGTCLMLVNPQPLVQKLLSMTQIDRVVPTHPSLQAALAADLTTPPDGRADVPAAAAEPTGPPASDRPAAIVLCEG